MEVLNPNGVKVYNLSAGKIFPSFLSETQKKKLSQDDGFRKRIELIQDFRMSSACQRLKMSSNGEFIIAAGVYPPKIRAYETSQLSMKFERHVGSEIVQMQILSEDYSKIALLESDRNIEFHAAYGNHYKTRIPKYGRDMTYHKEQCDLLIVGSCDQLYRLNLIQGQFYQPFKTNSSANNRVVMCPVHQLFWDVRTRRAVSVLPVSSEELTALRFTPDGLGLGVGTSKGLLRQYDLRMATPSWEQQYQYELPIVDLKFQGSHMFGCDQKVVKIWDSRTHDHLCSIEAPGAINNLCLVPRSGLLMLACDYENMMSYYIPSLGPAPSWCSFLDNITEELEEEKSSIYTDYKFVTQIELESLGLGHLIGTKLLRAYMHGFFMDYKLYNKVTAIADPEAYERWRKAEIQRKTEEKREKRIVVRQRLPRVNKKLAEKFLEENKAGSTGKEILNDDRFRDLFTREEFQIDEASEEFKLRNPSGMAAVKRRAEDSDNDIDMEQFIAVDPSSGGEKGFYVLKKGEEAPAAGVSAPAARQKKRRRREDASVDLSERVAAEADAAEADAATAAATSDSEQVTVSHGIRSLKLSGGAARKKGSVRGRPRGHR